MRKDGKDRIEWHGNDLCLIGRHTAIVSIVQGDRYPAMWRVRYPDGVLSDIVNVTRARDAARAIAGAILNARQMVQEGSPIA